MSETPTKYKTNAHRKSIKKLEKKILEGMMEESTPGDLSPLRADTTALIQSAYFQLVKQNGLLERLGRLGVFQILNLKPTQPSRFPRPQEACPQKLQKN